MSQTKTHLIHEIQRRKPRTKTGIESDLALIRVYTHWNNI